MPSINQAVGLPHSNHGHDDHVLRRAPPSPRRFGVFAGEGKVLDHMQPAFLDVLGHGSHNPGGPGAIKGGFDTKGKGTCDARMRSICFEQVAEMMNDSVRPPPHPHPSLRMHDTTTHPPTHPHTRTQTLPTLIPPPRQNWWMESYKVYKSSLDESPFMSSLEWVCRCP